VTADKRKRVAICPFWSNVSKKCSISNGGLFIPLDDHAETYCYSLHFGSCSQYTFHSENQILLQERVRKTEENRRKHLRFEASYYINTVKIFEFGERLAHSLPEAKTIDMSKGGMRMVIDTPLADHAMIQFSFDESFLQKLNDITGQVEWCNKQIDEPGYQAGISFKETHIIEAMGNYLEQQAL
jgi:hypothetical protein